MPDLSGLSGLATRMPRDKGYARAAQKAEAPSPNTFVCPRANAYGGREGIIPPAVAAVRGLVPKGMRRIAVSDTARRANEARDSGVGEAEQYLEYYGKAAAQAEPKAPPAPPAPSVQAQAGKPTKAARPARPAKPAKPAKASKASRPARPGRASPPKAEGVLRDPDDPGMFSRDTGQPDADDTLDGFYDSLAAEDRGTAGQGPGPLTGAVLAGVDMGDGQGETVEARWPVRPGPPPPAPLPRTETPPGFSTDAYAVSAAMAKLAEERAELGRAVVDLNSQVEALRAQLWDAQRQLESRAPQAEAEAETVRVALSADEERLKIGGRGWECNVVGRLHLGRGGVSAALTVSDPSYGSELLASIQPGEVVVLSSSARTYCTYAGHCVKIYGDADSQDFITMVQFGISPEGSP